MAADNRDDKRSAKTEREGGLLFIPTFTIALQARHFLFNDNQVPDIVLCEASFRRRRRQTISCCRIDPSDETTNKRHRILIMKFIK